MKKQTVQVQGTDISLVKLGDKDFISLTDIARFKNAESPKDIVKNWLRNKNTIEFLGLWERLNNPKFKGVEFDSFRNAAGSNAFVLSPQKWIESTNAIGLISRSGNNGGTFAHQDIAFEFASWLSPEFKLYLIKEFQRLKEDEQKKLDLGWDVKRLISKANYKIHTDAVKNYLIPPTVTKEKVSLVYANEADIINVALFGMTAKAWRDKNPNQDGNIRDCATVEQLIVLNNLEILNAEWIKEGIAPSDRLIRLNQNAITQMKALSSTAAVKRLKGRENQS